MYFKLILKMFIHLLISNLVKQISTKYLFKIHYLREDFNSKLKVTRAKKLTLQKETQELVNKLKQIQCDISEKNRKPIPSVFTIDHNLEFPERELEVNKEMFFHFLK